uniref:Uncharacterized protein n=1 Tax=Oryza brachyantha TaxID=4533 RepID=J3MGU9_ORYBR
GAELKSSKGLPICCTSCGESIFMQETLFTNSLEGHRQRGGHHPLGRRIQAASLISKGFPTGPQG